jgi:peptidoglycan/LPS O-acetylase OafA/YrhL
MLDLIKPQESLNLNGLTFIWALLFLQFIVPSSAVLLTPMWSLSVEMFMNLFFAFMGATWRRLVLVALLSFTALSFAVFTNTAMNVSSGWIAFSRGIFAFSCGLIARILHNNKSSNSRVEIVTSCVIVGTIFCFVAFSNYYLILVAPSMSFLIYAVSGIRIKKDYLKNLCKQCGNFSYGVYLWHFPLNYFVVILMPAINESEDYYFLKIVEFILTISFSLALTWITLALFKKMALFKIK